MGMGMAMDTITRTRMDTPTNPGTPAFGGIALLRLLQLSSPALPIGAFAYSHALEQAVSEGWVHDAQSAEDWIGGLLEHNWARLDVPLLRRIFDAIEAGDTDAVSRWSALLRASRESAELLAEDLHLGGALAELMRGFALPGAEDWARTPRPFAAVLAAAAVHWRIPLAEAALALLWTYVEHQVGAAVKLVPLGQTQGQHVLHRLAARIPPAVTQGLSLADEEIGATAPGLALASAHHETLYTRLFRS